MEVVDTHVFRVGDAHLVEFQGEGGEQIRVTLAAGTYPVSDDELVESAKAVLVQVATFGVEQRTPTGVVDMTDERSVDADSYTLEYQDDGQARQVAGIRLPHLAAVEEEVRRSAEDLWRDALSNNRVPTGWAVRARDANGIIVASIDYSELQQLGVDDAMGG